MASSREFSDPHHAHARRQKDRVRTAHQPASTGLELVTISRGLNTGSLRMPSRLAHRARPIRQYWADPTLSRLLPPSPTSSGSGCRQLHPTATTAKRRRSLTSIRTISASRRTTDGMTRPPPPTHSGPPGGVGPMEDSTDPDEIRSLRIATVPRVHSLCPGSAHCEDFRPPHALVRRSADNANPRGCWCRCRRRRRRWPPCNCRRRSMVFRRAPAVAKTVLADIAAARQASRYRWSAATTTRCGPTSPPAASRSPACTASTRRSRRSWARSVRRRTAGT